MGLEVGSLPKRTATAAATTYTTAATAVSSPSSAVMTDDTTNAPVQSIERSTYPLPPPLTRRLKAAILPSIKSSVVDAPVVLIESPATALQYLVENSLTAMDLMYFATPATIRQDSTCMSHRLCLRIATNRTLKTLTITDLGIGMTRADVINILGVGRTMNGSATVNGSDASGAAKRRVSTSTNSTSGTASSDEDEEEDDDDDDDNTNNNDDDATQDDDETAEEDGDHHNQSTDRHGKKHNNNHDDANTLSCKKTDIGGFYSALCALGMGVKVGTKSKFDDYYELQVGCMDPNENGSAIDTKENSLSLWDEFVISRPRDEGTLLQVATGFDQFEQIRGESGTMVCIRLRPQHYNLLDEQGTLVPLLSKILERTQYTFAVSSSEQRQAIIEASALEAKRIKEVYAAHSHPSSSAAATATPAPPLAASSDALIEMEKKGPSLSNTTDSYNSVKERAKYIPLRLSLGERKMLRLVEAAMVCCDYTSQVDRPFKNDARRTHEQLKGVTSVLRGLVTASDYSAGKKLAKHQGDASRFSKYQSYFRQMFEIARRHKIMNPEKMRTEYGKLVYLMQDAVSEPVQAHLGFSIIGPILTVYRFLEERDGLAILEDKHIETATEEILAEKKTRATIVAEIRRKERAVNAIKRKHKSDKLSADDIHLCLYSICDNNSFLNSNRVPVDKIIAFLTKHFSPDRMERGYSLSIVKGIEGSRLSHSHERQYYFALQSLTLWRDIIDDMFRLWATCEADLLNESVAYSLQDTGQGMQRVQQSPRTYKAMQQILIRVQGKVKHWVGSSVIHLGDHNVPNSLSFIDKYTQVPRILGPIVACLEQLEKLCEEDFGIQDMVEDGFGGMEKLRKDILYDFFRSAFDGSGADNFYDAGSCIDGRLTSAWNWCSQLPHKPFYPIFKLTGFTGFDGEFK